MSLSDEVPAMSLYICQSAFSPFLDKGDSLELFVISFYLFSKKVIHLNRPLRCQACCFPCCLQELEVVLSLSPLFFVIVTIIVIVTIVTIIVIIINVIICVPTIVVIV